MPIFQAILLGLSNSVIRGGWIKKWFPGLFAEDWIHAAIFGGLVYWHTHNALYSGLMAVAMFLGSMNSIFAKIFDHYKEDKDYLKWCWVAFKRGVVWCSLFVVVSCIFYGSWGLLFIVPMIGMPLAYSVDWLAVKFNRWALAETIFGIMCWFPFFFI